MGFLSNLLGNAGVATVDELNKEFGNLLTDNEQIEIGFKLFRDVFIFTNKRLILVDKQGLTGKKINYLSVVYKSISPTSAEMFPLIVQRSCADWCKLLADMQQRFVAWRICAACN